MRTLVAFLFAGLALAACQTMPPKGPFTAQQLSTLKQNGFEPAGEDWQFGMADRLLFEVDQSTLIPAQRTIISRIAASLLGVGIHGARIDGHTDSTGAAAYNEALSGKRAQAVADALQAGGMARSALRVVAMGERDPINNNRSAAGRHENRRVVIIVSPSDATAP